MRVSKYQDWVPREAIRSYEAASSQAVKAQAENKLLADSLKRLAVLVTSSDKKIGELWTLLNGKPVAEGGKPLQSWFFPSFACRWIIGPMNEELRTPAERKKWIDDVSTAAKELARLVKGTALDNYFSMYLPAYRDGHIHERVSVTLQALVARIEKVTPLSTKKPNDAKARRAYFVRQMTAYLVHHFNQPHREIVTAVTNIVFEGEISVRQIQSLAKVADTRKRKASKVADTRKRKASI